MLRTNNKRERPLIDLIHDGRHVGFAIIMQISYTLLKFTLATQMICFKFIECLSPPKQ